MHGEVIRSNSLMESRFYEHLVGFLYGLRIQKYTHTFFGGAREIKLPSLLESVPKGF